MFYIVATPIGNKEEITLRAISILKSCDSIYCEDTRHSGILMQTYDIHTPLLRLDKFSEKQKSQEIIQKLQQGQNLALISDAGMPLISDPGNILLTQLIQNNLQFTVVSGACALVNALVLSGLDTSRFFMAGFLPEKTKDKDILLSNIVNLPTTLIFYTPPHDIDDYLKYLHSKLGNRQVAIIREISKLYEEVIRFTLGAPPNFIHKGEMIIVIQGKIQTQIPTDDQIIQEVHALQSTSCDKKQSIKQIAAKHNLPKSKVYNLIEKENEKTKNQQNI